MVNVVALMAFNGTVSSVVLFSYPVASEMCVLSALAVIVKVQHFQGNLPDLVSCRELDEKINTTFMSVQ